MAEKFIQLNSGQLQENEALQSSAGAGDAGKIPALDSTGRFSSTMMPVGIGADTKTIEASEDLSAGDIVNIHDDTGEKVRKADASNGRFAHGFVLSGATSGANALVYFEGPITGLTSITPGAFYYLSGATAGDITTTAPSTSTHYVQEIGVGMSATEISFEPQRAVQLA